MKLTETPTTQLPRGIESLRGRKDPEAVRAAAREMESLFAYEMVKAMRASAGGETTGDGFGGEVYGTLFDMELAKVLASKGLGLQELLLKGLGRGETSQDTPGHQDAASPAPVRPSVDFPAPAPSRLAPQATGKPISPSSEDTSPIREGGRVSSDFGYRKDPFTGAVKFHHGVDIAAPEGTPVYSVKGGEVTFSGHQPGYGNVVVVDHGDGFVSKYAHNRANRVAAGDRVGTDTVIAEVGSTGRSTGPHLHFEVRYEGNKIHPEAVFAGIAKGRG